MTAALVLWLISGTWIVAGLAAVYRIRTRSRDVSKRRRGSMVAGSSDLRLDPVTVLKPLCGFDQDLEANLRTFFVQDHPHCELLFGVESAEDPAITVVERLIAAHPTVRAKLIVHGFARGENPKVRNLVGMLSHASFDLLLVSDSNVRVPSHYVSEMAREHQTSPRSGLVTSLFAGVGEDTLGAALENAQLNGFCAAGTALPTLLGYASVVGKSLLFSRRVFESLGGFARVADVLAEDFVIGKMFQHAGLDVRVAPSILENVTRNTSVRSFVARQLRWSMLRFRMRPLAALLEPLTSPVFVALITFPLLGAPALLLGGGLLVLRDVGGWLVLRGFNQIHLPLVVAPLRELLMAGVWLAAPFKKHVEWRGHRVRLDAGTLLFAVSNRR